MTEPEMEIIREFQRRRTLADMNHVEFNKTMLALQKLDRLSKEVTDSLGCTLEEVPANVERLGQKIIKLKNDIAVMKDKLGES